MLIIIFSFGTPALQRRYKKCVDRKRDYAEKNTSFGCILWEFLDQYMHLSVDSCTT